MEKSRRLVFPNGSSLQNWGISRRLSCCYPPPPPRAAPAPPALACVEVDVTLTRVLGVAPSVGEADFSVPQGLSCCLAQPQPPAPPWPSHPIRLSPSLQFVLGEWGGWKGIAACGRPPLRSRSLWVKKFYRFIVKTQHTLKYFFVMKNNNSKITLKLKNLLFTQEKACHSL